MPTSLAMNSYGEDQIIHNSDRPEDLEPPDNFAMVQQGIYRSAFPKRKNFEFLKKLNLKTILTLVLEDLPLANKRFCKENGITILQFGVPGNKEPFVDIPEKVMRAALSVLLDTRFHPVLIHCNKGKHRTGSLVGCLRKMEKWSHTSICDEYRRFSYPKSRASDQQFIELFNTAKVKVNERYVPAWLT
eukprot:Clim_evm69s109 gene=Clim_evmTU69s109